VGVVAGAARFSSFELLSITIRLACSTT